MIILLYGRPKVGKSTMTKNLKTLEVENMTVADARILRTLTVDSEVLVIDSSTVLLDLLERSTAASEGVASIADIEWGKGKPRLLTRFRDVVNNLTKDKIAIIISHERLHESKYLSLLTPEIDEWLQIRADWICALRRDDNGGRSLFVRNTSFLGHRDIEVLNELPDTVPLDSPKASQEFFEGLIAKLLEAGAQEEETGTVSRAAEGEAEVKTEAEAKYKKADAPAKAPVENSKRG